MQKTKTNSRLLATLLTVIMLIGIAPISALTVEASETITVYVSFEGYNLGHGFYIEPTAVTVPASSTSMQPTHELLTQRGHTFSFGGFLDNISGFNRGFVIPPPYITVPLNKGCAVEGGSLGAFMFTAESGWMITVNHVLIGEGAGTWLLSDGDVIRWQFSVQGLGADLGVDTGVWGEAPLYNHADKTELIRALFADGVSDSTRQAALDVIINPLATVQQVEDALAELAKTPTVPKDFWFDVNVTGGTAAIIMERVNEILINDFGQTTGNFDYSVVKRLRVSGTLSNSTFNWGAIRGANALGPHLVELDLSGLTGGSAPSIIGSSSEQYTALRHITMPAGINATAGFSNNPVLETITWAGNVNQVGGTSLAFSFFENTPSLRALIFLGDTAPTFSNNASNANQMFNHAWTRWEFPLVAYVRDRETGGFELYNFRRHFSEVRLLDVANVPTADREALNVAIAKAQSLNEADFTPSSWTAMQSELNTALLLSSTATQADVERAKSRLLASIDALILYGYDVTFISVPQGTSVGVYRKGSNHFAPFETFTLTRNEYRSTSERDVYLAEIPLNTDLHIEASIPSETVKYARRIRVTTHGTTITVDPMPLSEWTPVNNAHRAANLYTNLDDTGTINLNVGGTFNLDTFRVWQAVDNETNNYFIEPNFSFEIFGDSITTERIGSAGREQLQITAVQPGVSVIKITYGPLIYNVHGQILNFNAIDPGNIGLAVVNVGDIANIGTFATGIYARNDFDTYYFDNKIGYREFMFTPAAGTAVRVHAPLNISDWGSGWTNYMANPDSSFTVTLKEGRNIIELTNGGYVRYHVIRAKGVDVTVVNITNHSEDFAIGDTARISIVGIEMPVEKMAGIYNPGFGSALAPFIRYTNGNANFDSARAGQFTSLTTTYTVDYTLTDTSLNVLNGQIWIGLMGDDIGSHRNIPISGVGSNMSAVARGPFGFGALPEIVLPILDDTIPVDRTALNAAIAGAESRVQSNYTAASWAAMQVALTISVQTHDNANATQEQVDTAANNLNFAINALVRMPDPIYGINLSTVGTHVFPPAMIGYGTQVLHNVTVSNTGNQPTGVLTVALSGANAESFTLNRTSIPSITVGGSDSFTIVPNTGLAVGTHTATVTVSGGANITPQSFTVSFTVTAIPVDRTALNAAITGAESRVQSNYTAASWAAMQTILNIARQTRDNANSTQAQVDNAANNLNSAVNALVIYVPITPTPDWETAMNRALDRIYATTQNPIADSIGGEWAILALARSGRINADNPLAHRYLATLDATLANLLAAGRWTDLQRVALAVTSLGLDASDLNGHDLTAAYRTFVPINHRPLHSRATNADTFALIALDSMPYDGGREQFVQSLLDTQFGGGWRISATATVPDIDTTAMVVQALAPYYNSDSRVRTAIDTALDWLSRQNIPDAEGNAQMIVALSALGRAEASRYVDALLSFYDAESGGFMRNNRVNAMTTEQAAYALVAYWRFVNGMNTLYDMSDMFVQTPLVDMTALNAAITRAESRIQANYTSISWTAMQTALTAAIQTRNDTNAIRTEVDTAANNLNSAINALVSVITNVNRTALNTAIAAAENRVQSNYTVTSWMTMQSALTMARQVRNNTSATQEQVDSAANNLNSALNALVRVTVSQTYGINLSISGTHIFPAATVGYSARSPRNVTVSNTGNQPTGSLNVTLSGANAGSFTLSRTTIPSIAAGGNDSFTIVPNTGLAVGTHTATVTVSGGANIVPRSFTVSFTVTATPINRNALNYEIARANALRAADFTAASWSAMQNALTAATQARDNVNATQAQINTAANNLQTAINALVRVDGQIRARISVRDPNARPGQTSVFFAEREFILNPGETAYSLLRRTGLNITSRGNPTLGGMYVSAINGFGEFSDGPNSGWMYSVNGTFPDVSSSLRELQDGDRVEWLFTRNLGHDLGGGSLGQTPPGAGTGATPGTGGEAAGSGVGTGTTPNTGAAGGNNANNAANIANGVNQNAANSQAESTDSADTIISSDVLTGRDLIGSTPPSADGYVNPYIDVDADDWFAEAVRVMTQLGLMGGSERHETFMPNSPINRYMLATILHRLEGTPETSTEMSFSDVRAEQWYTNGVLWAYEAGVMNGFPDGTFGGNQALTREQIVTIFHRYAKSHDLGVSLQSELSTFVDSGDVSYWASEAMQWAVAAGLINGRTPTSIVPQGEATRAELATIMMRFLFEIFD